MVTIASPADTTDLIASTNTGHATSGTAIHGSAATTHAVDTAASIAKTESTAYVKNAAVSANIKNDVTSADIATNSTPTATSSTPNPSPEHCWVFTIPPDLPLTEDE
eukprot:g21880.t1